MRSYQENLENSHETTDLEQIHEDDLEAIDLKWQLSLLSVRAKKYYQKTGKKIFINGNDIAGYDKSKVECYNCHKLGHFAREYRASRSKEDQFRNQDNPIIKETKNTLKAMFTLDGVKQYDDLLVKQVQTKFVASTYKRGLDTIEAQLVTYRKNELEFKGYGPENSKKESNVGCEKESDNSKENFDNMSVSEVEPKKVREYNDAPVIEEWVSDDEEQDESKTKPKKKNVIPTAAKIKKSVKKSVRYAEMYRSQSPRGNQRNWNGQKSNQLGPQDFPMTMQQMQTS
ncbi:ribonuclease H-like domain-containing protein [Tanacetum coccineum]|uniref:Ribonuclease H-like domain-containing protein n=1 Tax=Tanacetum coccineum TaxID=301880 RepID=A0ABQ5IGB7_9ASTR